MQGKRSILPTPAIWTHAVTRAVNPVLEENAERLFVKHVEDRAKCPAEIKTVIFIPCIPSPGHFIAEAIRLLYVMKELRES
jgi:hypothetical protein